jgi:hypothetical protein
VPPQHRSCACGRQDLETKISEALHREDHKPFVPVGNRDEHRALGRQRPETGNLTLGEGGAESNVEAHYFAGRPHLRTEDGVDGNPVNGTEPVERHHRLFDRDRCRRVFGRTVTGGP